MKKSCKIHNHRKQKLKHRIVNPYIAIHLERTERCKILTISGTEYMNMKKVRNITTENKNQKNKIIANPYARYGFYNVKIV